MFVTQSGSGTGSTKNGVGGARIVCEQCLAQSCLYTNCLLICLVADTKLDLSEVDERVNFKGVPFRDEVHYVTIMLFGGLDFRPETSDPEVSLEYTPVWFYSHWLTLWVINF